MSNQTFMDKFRTFFGLNQQPPRNDFRNPIWGSDDYDDGDELYDRQSMKHPDPFELDREITKHMQDMFKSFGNVFGHSDFTMNFPEDRFQSAIDESTAPKEFEEGNIRDYYLKPGYHKHKNTEIQDTDLDGKISSNDISGLLKRKDGPDVSALEPYKEGVEGTGRSFFKTIITTNITKADGTTVTRRIVKDGNGVVEDTTTQTTPAPGQTSLNIVPAGDIYSNIMSDISSFWKLFH